MDSAAMVRKDVEAETVKTDQKTVYPESTKN
ncbi:MAG: hypothetical protein QOG72_1791 [Sphingomonadales bacterium]|jgi:hypothetical protein|nr:hypothetical protein [Sphingomonadales bacterium]